MMSQAFSFHAAVVVLRVRSALEAWNGASGARSCSVPRTQTDNGPASHCICCSSYLEAGDYEYISSTKRGKLSAQCVNQASAATTRRRQSQNGRAAPDEAVEEDEGMRAKRRKGQEAAARGAAGGSGGDKGKARIREETLVHASKVLEEFRASDAEAITINCYPAVYKFESDMSKEERAAIHDMCKKMGMTSKSYGSGKQRYLSVKKQKKRPDTEQGPNHFGFSEEARDVLQELFTHYPPDDAHSNGDAVRSSSYKDTNIKWKDSAFCMPAMRRPDIAKKIEMLTSKLNGSPQFRKLKHLPVYIIQIIEDRSKLPISSFKDVISSTLENHQVLFCPKFLLHFNFYVVLISGETGCGKTTQVPQFILDHMWGKGESCKIICTQPRRISAISVAERISAERGESVGDTVGYKIRLESKGGKNSSIMLCTNGVLLNLLIGRGTNNTSNKQHSKCLGDDAISGITHIIVVMSLLRFSIYVEYTCNEDEIHERDRFSDFMLTILRDLLPQYPHLRIVLMSATLDAERFSKYFDGCPVIQVPGFTYPVSDNHLNSTSCDLNQKCALTDDLRSSMDESINLALVNDEFDPLLELISAERNPEIYNYHHSETGVTPLMAFAAKGQLGDVCMLLSFGVDCSAQDHNKKSALDWAQQENQLEVKLLDSNCRIADFLKKTLDPPIPETIRNAITVLQVLGTLTQDEELTELGEKMGSLPLHPSITKMLLFAVVMNCLEPALTLACAADYRDPFLLPMAPYERNRAAAAKVELASLYGGFSDQLAVVAAFDCWRRAKDRGQESQFCTKYFISSDIMNMLSKMRKQLKNELSQRGLVPEDTSACSLNSKNTVTAILLGIMRAVLMAGDYPMVGRLLPRKDAKKPALETASGAKVRLHPRSCNFNLPLGKTSGNPLVIYDEITRGDSGMYIRNCSVVGSCPLFLLATEMVVAPPNDNDGEEEDYNEDEAEKNSSVQHKEDIMSSPDNTVTVVVDRWLRFEAMALDVAQIYCLRERLASAILFKVKNPHDILPPALGASIYAIACILSYDGLPAVVSSNMFSSNQASNQNSEEASRLSQGRGVGYIPPGGFLMSLFADKPHNATSFHKSSDHQGGASGHTQPSWPVGRYNQSQHSFRKPRGRSSKDSVMYSLNEEIMS
ncbi:hypothetical protein PR202_ga05522 [Eleusine coracana subsp. coracana]|uniref:RNA helicase n=1 Tax=Eleusine coracana subsp. coracana TaxID=191504 RepID=A0AAV5BT25_ELECO|nr:hypothetical protein PR202_ga05069 [Eleusine coracana subsp. coracana]GJM89340.1 hypothetical protein PR202_ga05522 [Eleusine coracana subsp. coracana]